MFGKFILKLIHTSILIVSSLWTYSQGSTLQIEAKSDIIVTNNRSYLGETKEEFGGLITSINPGENILIFYTDSIVLTDTLIAEKNSKYHLKVNLEEQKVQIQNLYNSRFSNGGSPLLIFGTLVDNRDNRSYRTIRINDMVWMAENLAFNYGPGNWYYELNKSYGNLYGRLYNWETALHACPEGWHLPTDEDWSNLEKELGMQKKYLFMRGWREASEENDMKSISGWHMDGNGKNTNGFTVLPAGYRQDNGVFNNKGYYAYFWTATPDNDKDSWYRVLTHDINHIGRFSYSKEFGFSVRCLKN